MWALIHSLTPSSLIHFLLEILLRRSASLEVTVVIKKDLIMTDTNSVLKDNNREISGKSELNLFNLFQGMKIQR